MSINQKTTKDMTRRSTYDGWVSPQESYTFAK